MAEPIVPGTDVNVPTPPAPQAKTYTEEEKNSAAAAARKDAEAKSKDLQSRLDALEAEKKEREEAELTELDKIKKQYEEVVTERDTHKVDTEWRKEWETKEAMAIEESMEGLTDNQKSIVNGLPLVQRRSAITEFKGLVQTGNPDSSKGIISVPGVPTLAEVVEIEGRLGAGHPEAKKAWRLYQDNKK